MRNASPQSTFLAHNQGADLAVEAFIYATIVGAVCFQPGGHTGSFADNRSSVPLIAGDQPVINRNGAEAKTFCLLSAHARPCTEYTAIGAIYTGRANSASWKSNSTISGFLPEIRQQIYGNDRDYLKALSGLPKKDALA